MIGLGPTSKYRKKLTVWFSRDGTGDLIKRVIPLIIRNHFKLISVAKKNWALLTTLKVPICFNLAMVSLTTSNVDNIYCLKEEDLLIYGLYSYDTVRKINILVNKCKDQEYCLSEKEIQDWFNSKLIALRMNRVRFDAA